MNILQIIRGKNFATWIVRFVHDGQEFTVEVKIENNKLVYAGDAANVPAFALDLIRTNLALRGDISRGFLNESVCRVPQANW